MQTNLQANPAGQPANPPTRACRLNAVNVQRRERAVLLERRERAVLPPCRRERATTFRNGWRRVNVRLQANLPRERATA
jgi:hypothetical protein